MRKKIVSLLVPFALFGAMDGELYDGYTYFGVGIQHITYSEDYYSTALNGDVSSQAKGVSPVYFSGSLVRVNNVFDFSIDVASTLIASKLEEEWKLTGVGVQKNEFDATLNSLQILGHYKFNNNHRFVVGVSYRLNNYKRYTFKDANGNELTQKDPVTGLITNVAYGLVQESVSTFYATAGYWYESSPVVKKNSFRYKISAVGGIPVWTSASNTAFEKVTFNKSSGYIVDLNGYIGYTVYKGIEIGMFGGYSYLNKTGTNVANDGHTKWPSNKLKIWQTGLSFVWNFNKSKSQ